MHLINFVSLLTLEHLLPITNTGQRKLNAFILAEANTFFAVKK